MKTFGTSLLAVLMVASFSAPALAQGKPQPINVVDIKSIGSGYRATKILGSQVVNEQGETVGTIDDLIIGRTDHSLYAVLSVGGFLGIANRLVAVRYQDLKVKRDNSSFVLPGATKDELKALPEYKYAS